MDSITTIVLIVGAGVVAWIFYSVALHPLAKFPGPIANQATPFPKILHLLSGTLPHHVADLHARYGPVVRLAPNELSFTDPRAWRDIYTRKLTENRYELPHDMGFYNATNHHPTSVLASQREAHDDVRKLLSPGFSDRAMKAQEPVIGRYVDLLIQRLRESSTQKNGKTKAVNMRDWIAYCTFDLIGSLAFGSDFGCLQDSTYHPYVAVMVNVVKDMSKLQVLQTLGLVSVVSFILRKLGGVKTLEQHSEMSRIKAEERVKLGAGQNDFMDGLVAKNMDIKEIKENAGLLIAAGSETTATLLAGALYLLCKNPTVLENLAAEITGEFESEDQITLTSVNVLLYMLAVLKESLRYYPPVAGVAPRKVPRGGAVIAGKAVPQGTTVGVWQWAMYRDSKYFKDPYKFDTDRFVGGSKGAKYPEDRPDVLNPFLLGPRNCIGQNLAYAEMRLILARLVWNFDMKLCDESKMWMEGQKNYLLWYKPDLMMELVAR